MYTIRDGLINGQALVILENESQDFAATIAPGFGGACVGLRHGDDELLHHACVFGEGAMKGRIPVLFPVVGRSFEQGELGTYCHRGQVYPMDIHGFVKDMAWQVIDRQSGSDRACVTCQVVATDETRRSYPYDFSLSLEYAVGGTSLSIAATIRNSGSDTMPFCFGYHPYFRAPIGDGRRGDCIVRIPGQSVWEMSEGQPTGQRLCAPCEFARGLALPPDHLERILTDIVRVEDAPISSCELVCTEVGKTLRVEFDEQAIETITVYSPPDSGYVCLEPRCGLPNALSDSAPVREGVKELAPGETFQTTVTIRVVA